MEDRCAVLTTLNGEVVEWRVFETQSLAMGHYNQGVKKLQKMLNHTDDEGVWEIMLCDVKQYALSHQNAENRNPGKSSDWYSKYFEIMSRRSRRDGDMKRRLSLDLMKRLKEGVDRKFSEDTSPMGGT